MTLEEAAERGQSHEQQTKSMGHIASLEIRTDRPKQRCCANRYLYRRDRAARWTVTQIWCSQQSCQLHGTSLADN